MGAAEGVIELRLVVRRVIGTVDGGSEGLEINVAEEFTIGIGDGTVRRGGGAERELLAWLQGTSGQQAFG